MTQKISTKKDQLSNIYQSIFSLPVMTSLSEHAYLSQIDELDVIAIKHPKFNAVIAKQGAHLMSWQPVDSEPIIWISENSPFKAGKAIRGGIPICWPWFGPAGSPSHGFARTSLWTLEKLEDSENALIITFSLTETEETLKIWPHAFNLQIQFKFDESCHITLTTKGAVNFTGALHTYFNLSDIQNAKVKGVGTTYIDSLKNKEFFTDNVDSSTEFKTHIDRIFTEAETSIELHDSGYQHQIILENSHFISEAPNKVLPCDIVIWNPGAKLSQTMADMADDGYLTMGCIESAIITHPILLDADQKHVISVRISHKAATDI